MWYNINSLKIGLKVIQNKEPCVIISNEFINPGKGQSFNRIRFRQIVSGKIIMKTLKSGEFLESADIIERKLVYVYRDGDFWYFMDDEDFEQVIVHNGIMRESLKWMVEQLYYIITFWNDTPILVTPPDFVKVKVIKTDLVAKSVSVSSGNKFAVVETGEIVRVPFFVQTGEYIKVNTRSGAYISRVFDKILSN